jgi:hypothetical protein
MFGVSTAYIYAAKRTFPNIATVIDTIPHRRHP